MNDDNLLNLKASCLTALVTHFSTWGIRCWSSQAWVWPILPMTAVQKRVAEGGPIKIFNKQRHEDTNLEVNHVASCHECQTTNDT